MIIDQLFTLTEGVSAQDLADTLAQRLESRHPEVFQRYAADTIADAAMQVADFHVGAEKLGTSDIGIMTREVLQQLERGSAAARDLDEAKFVDVDAIHAEALREHLLANPEMYESREDFSNMRKFLDLHATAAPTVGNSYIYASVQTTPISNYVNIACFKNPHKLVKLVDDRAYFDIDGTTRRFPTAGKLSGDALSKVYFFESNQQLAQFMDLVALKFANYKVTTKTLDHNAGPMESPDNTAYVHQPSMTEEKTTEAIKRLELDDEVYQDINYALKRIISKQFGGRAWVSGGDYAYLIDVRKPKLIYSSDGGRIAVRDWAHGLEDHMNRYAFADLAEIDPTIWVRAGLLAPANKISGQGDYETGRQSGDFSEATKPPKKLGSKNKQLVKARFDDKQQWDRACEHMGYDVDYGYDGASSWKNGTMVAEWIPKHWTYENRARGWVLVPADYETSRQSDDFSEGSPELGVAEGSYKTNTGQLPKNHQAKQQSVLDKKLADKKSKLSAEAQAHKKAAADKIGRKGVAEGREEDFGNRDGWYDAGITMIWPEAEVRRITTKGQRIDQAVVNGHVVGEWNYKTNTGYVITHEKDITEGKKYIPTAREKKILSKIKPGDTVTFRGGPDNVRVTGIDGDRIEYWNMGYPEYQSVRYLLKINNQRVSEGRRNNDMPWAEMGMGSHQRKLQNYRVRGTLYDATSGLPVQKTGWVGAYSPQGAIDHAKKVWGARGWRVGQVEIIDDELTEFAPPSGGDGRSEILKQVKQLLDAGNRVDWTVPGQMGHVERVQDDGVTLRRWNRPHSKMRYFLPVTPDRDDQYQIKLKAPKHYVVVSSNPEWSQWSMRESVGDAGVDVDRALAVLRQAISQLSSEAGYSLEYRERFQTIYKYLRHSLMRDDWSAAKALLQEIAANEPDTYDAIIDAMIQAAGLPADSTWEQLEANLATNLAESAESGSPGDRGSADAWYHRPKNPHKIVGGKSVALTDPQEIAQYNSAYQDEIASGVGGEPREPGSRTRRSGTGLGPVREAQDATVCSGSGAEAQIRSGDKHGAAVKTRCPECGRPVNVRYNINTKTARIPRHRKVYEGVTEAQVSRRSIPWSVWNVKSADDRRLIKSQYPDLVITNRPRAQEPARPRREKIDYEEIARKIEDVVGKTFPDGDPLDWLIPYMRRRWGMETNIGTHMDRAARKYLRARDYYDYLAKLWDQVADDNLMPKHVTRDNNPWRVTEDSGEPRWVLFLNGKPAAHYASKSEAEQQAQVVQSRKPGTQVKIQPQQRGMLEGLRDPADNPCWKGYHPVGTKKKNGRTVPNCVPKKS